MRMKLFCYISLKLQANPLAGGGGGEVVGGGYTPSYKLCTYVLSQTLPFRSEYGYRLCSFWCGIAYGGVYEDICPFNSR